MSLDSLPDFHSYSSKLRTCSRAGQMKSVIQRFLDLRQRGRWLQREDLARRLNEVSEMSARLVVEMDFVRSTVVTSRGSITAAS